MEEENKRSEILILKDFWPRWSERSMNEIKFNLIETTKNVSKKNVPEADKVQELFTDKEVCILPIKYQEEVYYWKRPDEIFEDKSKDISEVNIILYAGDSQDLRKANSHLKLSSYYYNIIDAFNALIMYKNWTEQDFKGFGFSTWKPINHIYSGSKVQQGVPHDVTINQYGKYAIRLFHCGAWRQIIVDNRIPINTKNQILMPCIRTETTLELWPILITKAILKINFCRMEDEEFYIDQRHSPQCKMYNGKTCYCKTFFPCKKEYLHEEKNLSRLNVIYALTGWFPLETDLSGYYESKAWNLFSNILQNYKIPEKPQIRRSLGKTGKVKQGENLDYIEESKIIPLVLINIVLPSSSAMNNNRINFIDLLCTQCRNIPLSGNKKESLPLWKTFRWIYWAMEKNIWKPFGPSILCNLPVSLISNFQELFENEWAKIIEKHINSKLQHDRGIAQKTKKGKTNVEPVMITDHWIQFNKIIPYLQYLEEYKRIYSFKTALYFTDEIINETVRTSSNKEKGKKTGPETKDKKEQHLIPEEIEEMKKIDFKVDQTTEIFLFTDQENQEEIFFDLSVVKTCPPEKQSALLEKFKWYCPTQKTLWNLKTDNFAFIKICARKGRSVFRLRFNASMFCLRVHTNAPLKAAYFNDLLNIMDSESVRLTKYVAGLGSAFQDIIKALGTDKFPEMVQNFFRALLQYCDKTYHINVPVRHFIYDKFLQFVLQFLKLLENEEAKIAFQRLFILPNFSRSYKPYFFEKIKMKKEDYVCDCYKKAELLYTEDQIKTWAAITIQSIMKGYYVRRLKRFHLINNKNDCENLKKALQKFYDKYFVKEPHLIFDLVRKFLFTSFEDFRYNSRMKIDIPVTTQIGNLYEFRKDFENSLHVLEYEGTVDIAFGWTPLRIGCFYCHSNTPQKYIFYTSMKNAGTAQIFTKIIRCDDFTELAPCKPPHLFTMSQKKAKAGYLVALYLYAAERVSGVSWMLQVGFPRYSSPAHFCNLCGLDKCHCPSDTKVNRLLENYILRCELVDMENFEVFRNEDTLVENDTGFVCQQLLHCAEKTVIFWFFSFEAEKPLNFIFVLTKQGGPLPLVKRKFSNRIDFFRAMNAGSYTLNIYYDSPNQSRKKQSLKSEKRSVSTFDEDDLEYVGEGEFMEESMSVEMGLWWLTTAYVKGADVVVA